MPDTTTFAARLRAARERRRLHPQTLAADAMLLHTRLVGLEAGWWEPEPGEVVRLARALGVPVEELAP